MTPKPPDLWQEDVAATLLQSHHRVSQMDREIRQFKRISTAIDI